MTAAFMAGMAAGSEMAGRSTVSVDPARARRGVVIVSFASAAWAAVSPWLVGTLGAPAYGMLFILPPAMLAGAGLPLLVAAADTGSAGATRLYAAQAFGAALGPVAAASLLLPSLGLRGTLWCAASLLAGAGAVAWRIRPASFSESSVLSPPEKGFGGTRTGPVWSGPWPAALAAVGGAFALAHQIVAYRLVALLVTGGSLRGYAMVLGVWLLAGGAAARRAGRRAVGRSVVLSFVVWWALGCLPGAWEFIPRVLRPLRELGSGFPLGLAEWLAVAALTAPPALAAGTLLARLLAAPAAVPAAAAGRLLAASTAGALTGGLGAGVLLIPALGLETFARAAGSLAAVCAAAVAVRERRVRVAPAILLANLAVTAAFLSPRSDAYALNRGEYNRLGHDREDAGAVLFQRDAALGRIAVTVGPSGESSCRVNGKPDGSTSIFDMLTQAGSAHIAMLLHPRPRRVLVIGLGTGVTAGVAALYPDVERVDVVEIEPAQVAAAEYFGSVNEGVLENPKVHILRDDARRFLRRAGPGWDVILSEPSNLFVSGMVNLFTAEFHRLVRARLAPGGLILQWVHYYRIDWDGWRGAVATTASVHPFTSVWLLPFGDTLVTGSDAPPVIDPDAWEARLRHPAVAANLVRMRMTGAQDLLRFFLWGPADAARAVAGGRPCTDDDPWLEFRSERIRYTPERVEENRLRMVLHAPLEPVPLAADSVSRRLHLARAFLLTGTHERARAEFARALVLAPGNREAREGVAAIPGLRMTQERDLARYAARR